MIHVNEIGFGSGTIDGVIEALGPDGIHYDVDDVALGQLVHHVDREQEALATIRFAEEMDHLDPSTAADADGITPPAGVNRETTSRNGLPIAKNRIL